MSQQLNQLQINLSFLLSKVLIRRGRTKSAAAIAMEGNVLYKWVTYVVRVLEVASPSLRQAIKEECLASDSPSQIELADLIAIYEALPAGRKAQFIAAFKATFTFVGHAPISVNIQNTHQNGQIPPVYPP